MLGIGLIVISLTGCATHSINNIDINILQFCSDREVPIVGETNGDLVNSYLDLKESFLICKGISNTLLENNK